ncbi:MULTISPECIES: phage tail protein [unclassified Campylobacter]|uniref:phage tail-collar fiber domain-containing protein n=1 Tax=unclassified Campylobacter TaxID=2593542 RepID=UPI003D3402D1
MNYFSILTSIGLAKLIKATANSEQIILSQMGVSDDRGEISQDMQTLPNVRHKFSINSITQSDTDKNVLICEGVISADVGGFYIRKVGIYTNDDELFAVGNIPESYKPLLAEGSAKDITIKFYLQVDNSANITLKVDNNIVLATRNFVKDEIKKLDTKFLPLTGKAADSDKLDGLDSFEYAKTANTYTKHQIDTMLSSGEFEAYNKAFVDEIKIQGLKDTSNNPNPFNDDSCIATFKIVDNVLKELNNRYTITKNTPYKLSQGKFGSKLELTATAGEAPVVNDYIIKSWFEGTKTISFHTTLNEPNKMYNTFLSEASSQYNIGHVQVELYNGMFRLHYYKTKGDTRTIVIWYSATLNLIPDKAYHFVVRGNDTLTELLIDGVKIPLSKTTSTSTPPTTPNSLAIGGWGNVDTRHLINGSIEQIRIFNRSLSQDEINILAIEKAYDSSSPNNLTVKAKLYLSDGKKENGLYDNKAYNLNTFLAENGLINGDYYIKAKYDNSIELIADKPSIGTKSSTSEYYIDGTWYSKTDEKLQRQTYLPYIVTVSGNKFAKLTPINLYPSDTGIGINQTWQNMTSQRQAGVTYTNTTGRPIQVLLYITRSSNWNCNIVINGIGVGGGGAGAYSPIIPANATYKLEAVGVAINRWLELR